MDCRTLDELIRGKRLDALSPAEQRALELHLEGCSSCRELILPERFTLPLQPPPDLLSSILRETSGSACGRAGELLAERLDDELDDLDNRLVEDHADDCVRCDALRSAFSYLAVDLPAMRELEPEPGFANAVFALTSHSANPRRPRSSERIRRLWNRLVQRPRFAWEAAYVGAMLFWLVLGLPLVDLPGTPPHVRDYLPDLSGVRATIRALRDPAFDLNRRTWVTTRENWSSRTEELQRGIQTRGDELRTALASLDVEQGGLAIRGITEDTVEVVNQWIQNEDDRDNNRSDP